MSTITLAGTVAVPGTVGMSIATTPAQAARPAKGRRPAVPAKPAMLDVTLAGAFSADIPIASAERISPTVVAVESEVAVRHAEQVQFEDLRTAVSPDTRMFPAGRVAVSASLVSCAVTVDYGDGKSLVTYVGPWRGTPTIIVDGVALAKE